MEQYNTAKQQLKESLQERDKLQKQLDSIQQDIYDKETNYLANTDDLGNTTNNNNNSVNNYYGNIVKGFEHFSRTGHGSNNELNFNDLDRIFSLSSSTYSQQLSNSNT